MLASGGSKDRTYRYIPNKSIRHRPTLCHCAFFGHASFLLHFQVVKQRISEGFGLFKFDGLGGGLGQSGGEEHLEDFEAMLHLIEELRRDGDQVGAWVDGEWWALSP